MIKLIVESDKSSTYDYVVDYYTYYTDEGELEIPLVEIVQTDTLGILDTRQVNPDMYAESMKAQINNATKSGKYLGLWKHHIVVNMVVSKSSDEDSNLLVVKKINTDKSSYKSTKMKLKGDWDENNPDYDKLIKLLYMQERS